MKRPLFGAPLLLAGLLTSGSLAAAVKIINPIPGYRMHNFTHQKTGVRSQFSLILAETRICPLFGI
jgi:hypothetical protein